MGLETWPKLSENKFKFKIAVLIESSNSPLGIYVNNFIFDLQTENYESESTVVIEMKGWKITSFTSSMVGFIDKWVFSLPASFLSFACSRNSSALNKGCNFTTWQW